MSQTETIQTPQDYVNYTFNIEARGIAEASSELMGLSNTVGNILGQVAFKTSEFLSHTDMLAIGVGAAISSMFVSATRDAITFQQQVANVQAIGGEAINAGAIGDAAMEYSNKFGMATASMTEGLEALARAGITSTNVMKEVLAEGVKLSKLEGLDLEDSINDLISTTNLLSESGVDMNDANYGKLVQEMNQHIVSTSESAPINAQNIIQSLQHVGGYASASGMDQDDLFAVIAQLGARGTKGEMAGTALRAFIAAGQKDTAQRALSRVGLNVSDLWKDNGETMLSISEMKNVLDEALEARGYSKQEKLEFYSDFVGYKQANQIMKIDTSEVQKYKESIANAWDLGKKLETILGTVRGNLDRIWQITQNFMTKVGSKLLTVAGIILEPIRVMLEIFTSLPFADTAVAAGMIFIAFRTGLTIFNKLVPSMVGFMSGVSDVSKESANLRNIWRDTNSELQQAKEIFNMIKNQDREGLVNTAFDEHELIGRHKDELEDMIAGQHYMNSPLFKKYKRLPWDDLPKPMQYLIKLQLKGNEDFNKNYQAALEKAKEDAKLVSQTPLDLSSLKDDEKSQLEAINVWVKNIFDLLKTELTKGTDNDKPINNRNRNAQADILSSIFNNKIDRHVYGNYEFKYRTDDGGYDYPRLKNDIVELQNDIRDKVSAFENKNKNNITSAQLNTYKKLFTGVSEGGQANSLRANESEVRLVLETGQLEHHDNPWQGLKDEQVRIIARELGLSQYENYTSNNQGVSADVAIDLHDKLESGNFSNEEKQSIIDNIVEQTNEEWRNQVPIGPAVDPKKLLLENPQIANKIVSSLGIDASGFSDNTHAVHEYFKTERPDEELNKAAQIAFGVLKQNNDFSIPEQRELQYMMESLQRMKNTMEYLGNNALDLGFSDAIKDEMLQIVQDMNGHNDLFRAGAEELGEALVHGFVSEGLERHSPGRMYKEMYAELEAIKVLLSDFDISDYANNILSDFNPKQFAVDGKNKFQSYDVLIDNLITDALFSLENEWKGDRFTALDYLKGKAPEGADLKDALTNEEIVNFYKSLSSEDIFNEVQRLTMQDAQQSQHINEQIEALLRIKEEIRENFEQQKSTYKQLDVNDVELGAKEVLEGVSFPSFNIGSDPEAKRIYDKTWGDILFNYSGNKMLRDKPYADSPDALLSDVEGSGIPSFLDGKTLLEATTILNNAMVNGSAGLPINVINVRSGHLNTDEKTGIGYLTGITSTAYTDAMADNYYTGSKLKIYAPMGTKGFNFYDRNEFTLPANTAYIELSKTVDEYGEVFAEILLLTEEQMKAMGLSRTINGAYRVESDKTPFEQLFNPENVDTDYHINNTPADWLEYIDTNTQAITEQGKADAEFMNFLNSTLPTIVENSLHNGFIEMREVGEIIRSLIPDVHYYQQMMTLVQYAVQNLESDGGIFMEPAVWDNIKEAVFTSASYESYAREEAERQQQEQEELINARTASDINDSINYTEDIEKNSAMFGDMNGYYDYIVNNKYGRARRLLQNSSFFLDGAEYKKKRIFGFDEDGNSVQKGTEYVTDKNGNLVSNKRFRPRKWVQDTMIGAVDWAERTEYRVKDIIDRRYIASQEQAKKIGADNGLSKTREDFANILKPVQDFSGVLSDLSEIFPFLTPAVAGLNTALTIAGYAITTLEVMEGILAVARGEGTFAAMAESESTMVATAGKILLTAATWAESDSDIKAAIGKAILTGNTYLSAGAEALLNAVREIGLLRLLAIIAAIAALIAIVYLSEKNHAEALKENQKVLEENNKSMNAALANYKSLHQARLSAVNVGRQRIAALKESVALYKLETARSERLNNIRKKSQLENDLVWGETGSLRADMQTGKGLGGYLGSLFPVFRVLAGEYEPVADKHSENIYQTMSIIDETQQSNALTDFITRHDSSFGDAVQLYQKQHMEQFAQMDAFAPQLQELYEVETQAQRIYGKEGARDSEMFKRALQEVANETQLDGKTLGAYLDYMQVEANVENARMMARGGFNEIQAQIQSDVMQQLYGDNSQMGDLDSLQDTMLKAMVEDEARKAKRELFEQGMMSYVQAIYSFIGGRWDEGWSYVDAGNKYLQGMQTIDQNKQRILEESKEIAEESLRKDYGTGAYSIYGDTPFGGAVESAKSIGLSVPTSSSSQSHNSSITSSNTTKNINKTTSDAQTASNTAKKLIDQQKTSGQSNANAETSEESGEGLWLGDIAKSAVSGTLDFAKKYSPSVDVISAFPPDKEHSEVQPTVNKYEIKVEQININTEDDPEKIKSALMNLIIEMQEQITPRQVSRTIGELPQQVFNDAANMAQGVDSAIRNVVKDADNALNNAINGLNNQK